MKLSRPGRTALAWHAMPEDAQAAATVEVDQWIAAEYRAFFEAELAACRPSHASVEAAIREAFRIVCARLDGETP